MMADREKVIKGLEQFKADFKPFCGNGADWARVDDAIDLLKEQEPVEPIPPTDESDLWRCGNCNHQLFRCTHQRYCDMCGKAVKWE